MTQQQQLEFTQQMEVAMSWMRAVHEGLKANDSTDGPLKALEARLRETERIHQSQHEGLLKLDMALMAAESILQSEDENLKNITQAKIKELKNLWEETCTYIVHCHSRIEWAWLHWNEYLKAREELEQWLMKQQRSQELTLELQLGVKEKLWQVDQQRVVVNDIHGMAPLLERLLNEATDLHSRTQDPSLNSHAKQRLQEAYNKIRDGAEDRLSKLQKISEEHQMYQGSIHKFQSWLLSKTKDLTVLMEQEEPMEDKLQALQTLDVSIVSEEKTLQKIEDLAEAVREHTSPAGAELVVEEAEEIRLDWHKLRQSLCEAEEGLRFRLDSHTQYMSRCQGLREDLARLSGLLQNLDQELLNLQESRDPTEETEEQMHTLGEPQVEHLKSQLKELFRFSEDSHHLSDDVLAVVKEQQSVKCKATRMCAESESVLRKILQDPLLVYTQWSHDVSRVLESSAKVTDFSHVAMLVQSVERLHRESIQLQDRLKLVQMKKELLEPVFGPEEANVLQSELNMAIKNRELLHAQLLQRRSRLEVLITRTKDFGDAHESILSKLTSLEDGLVSADVLQPDILAKKSQSDQFRVSEIPKEMDVCDAQIMALESLVSSSPNKKAQFEKLCIDEHQPSLPQAKVQESEDNIVAHEAFHDRLLNIEKWLMIMKQKLKSFRDPSGEWNIEGRRHEVEKALEEFPAKELEMQHMEVQGLRVLERTSKEGQVHIAWDMKRLKESWLKLSNMSLSLQTYTVVTPLNEHSGPHLSTFAMVSHGFLQRQTLSRRREFEAWLSKQNALLSEILSRNESTLGAKDLKTSQDSLTALRTGVGCGQQQFELLLQEEEGSSSASAPDDDLDDLRYRWILYKSKLKECGDIRQRTTANAGSLLQRACRLALPLCLLFLALLLLLFLLPIIDEGSSCSVTNNYARSFNVMLRYQGPPPT
uniref:KASH domain-containing protein n=1 Tax=Gouania willdenowi TaxID=441366 RepID=A0A8C5EA24_GOUWI